MNDSRRLFGNVLFLGGCEITARLVAFVGTAYLARQLGPAGFGIIGFALAISAYVFAPLNAALNTVGSREIAREPARSRELAASLIVVKLALALAAFAIVWVVAMVLDKPWDVRLIVMLTGLTFFSLAFDTAWVYKGLENNFRAGSALVLGQLLYVVAVLAVVHGPQNLALVPLAQVLGELCAALFLALPLFRSHNLRIHFREGLKILRNSGFLTLSRLLRTLIFTFDIVLLGVLVGERAVGLYAAPYRFCFLLLAIAAAIHVSYLPGLTRASGHGAARISETANRSLALSTTLSAPMIVGGIVVAEPLLELLFGAGYAEAVTAFRLLILSIAFLFVTGVTHNIFLVLNRMNAEMRVVAGGAALNVALNLMLIPMYGLVGAASATVLAEAMILLLGAALVRRHGVQLRWRLLSRPWLAAVAMGIVLITLGIDESLIASVSVGALVYVLLIGLMHAVPEDAQPFLDSCVRSARRILPGNRN